MIGCDFDFYYGSKDNYMWQFLENIADEIEKKKLFAEDASSERCCDAAQQFLRRHTLWMYDVLQRYQRKPGHECLAGDDDIKQPDLADCTDVRKLFGECRRLNTVAFTSEKAAEWTFKKLGEAFDSYVETLPPWKTISKEKALDEYIAEKFQSAFLQHRIGQQNIDFYILPSPTGRSRVKGLGVKEKQNIYKYVLFMKGSKK